jgi:K+-sensing histidine kinase KdpD
MLRVTVADRGIGVSDRARARLFQPFSRAQSMAGGTGLGLYRCAGGDGALIVRMRMRMRMRIWRMAYDSKDQCEKLNTQY